ncbi:MAG: transcriptional regulator [Planctomycetes bacterium]|nr:transcriptional regulator [Planctomycetota bacterium]
MGAGEFVMTRKDDIVGIFCAIDDHRSMKKFFQEIFTPSERENLSLRWELMKKLHTKVPQRKIAEQLEISLCKITRGAKIVKDKTSISRQMLDRNN